MTAISSRDRDRQRSIPVNWPSVTSSNRSTAATLTPCACARHVLCYVRAMRACVCCYVRAMCACVRCCVRHVCVCVLLRACHTYVCALCCVRHVCVCAMCACVPCVRHVCAMCACVPCMYIFRILVRYFQYQSNKKKTKKKEDVIGTYVSRVL